MKVTVFGMAGCSGCEVVKKMFETHDVAFDYLDVMNPDNMALAQKYNVRGIPVTIVDNGTLEVAFIGSTVQTIQAIRDRVGI